MLLYKFLLEGNHWITYVEEAKIDQTCVFVHVGNQGDVWKEAQIDITYSVVGSDVTEIIFEAVRGTGFLSDIAIDDIKIENGACTGLIWVDLHNK